MTRGGPEAILGRGALALALVLGLGAPAVARAAEPVALESPVLRLEVTADPYSYRLLVKATGQVLVAHAGTTFTAAEPAPAAADAGPGDAAADAGAADAVAAADAGGDAAAAADAVDTAAADAAAAGDAGAPPPPLPRALPVLRATNVTGGAGGAIEADLVLDGAADTARVRFSFASPEVLEVALAFDGARPPLEPRRVQETFADQQENVFGIWGYPWSGRLDNRGVDRDYLGLGQNTGSLYTSGRAPFYLTSRGYGVYARSQARGRFTVAVAGKTGFWFDEPRLTYNVIYGPGYYDVLGRYTALAGGPFMPPLWAFGSIWWADDFHRDLRGLATAQDSVIDLATQLQQRRIPAAALMVDRPFGTGQNGWGNMDWDASFPDPPRMVADLRARGLELVVWIANRAWNGLYTEGNAQGLLFPASVNVGPAADLRNPAAYAWMKGKLATFPDLGVKGYKIDRGEQNEHPDAVQNQNVTLFARLADESLAARHGAGAGFVFARNVADVGRRHAAVWNGDAQASFQGLRYSVAAALRSGMIVMPMWGSDTGGYLRNAGSPDDELFARWFGFSAYSPMMEVLVGDGHTPWYHHAPALVEIARKHAAIHHDLIPYVRSFMHAASSSGVPVMRPLLFEFPDDPEAARLVELADQYLYGSELMVAPVLAAGATSRAVYLPAGAGRWLDYNGRRQVGAGPGMVTADAPLDTIPVFVREGAIVPRGDILRGNNDWTPGWAPALRIEVFPGEAGGRQLAYHDGAAVKRFAVASEAAGAGSKVTITLEDPGLPATLEVQLHRIGRVTSNGTELAEGRGYGFDPAARVLSIPVRGATTVVVEDALSVFAAAAQPMTAPPPDAGAADARDAPAGTTGSAAGAGGCSCRAGARGSGGGGAWLVLTLLPLLRSGRRWRRRSCAGTPRSAPAAPPCSWAWPPGRG
jgi:alpha-D-xyloside xylohydrolase